MATVDLDRFDKIVKSLPSIREAEERYRATGLNEFQDCLGNRWTLHLANRQDESPKRLKD